MPTLHVSLWIAHAAALCYTSSLEEESNQILRRQKSEKRQVTFGRKRSHKVPNSEQRDMGWRS
jgi:hypothetical protein